MRIVQIVEHLDIGGLEKLVVDLVREHLRSGHDSHVICVGKPGTLAEQAKAAGATLTAFNKRPGFCPKTIFRMAQHLRKVRPHVVHTHSWVIHHYGVAAARLARVPLVINTRHSVMRSARQERWFRPCLPFTDAVVLVADDVRDSFVNNGGVPAQKAHVIRNGIPVEKFLQTPASPGSARPLIRFGAVGRLVEVKDHRTLIEAFGLLRDLPDAELHILGDGPLREALSQQVRQLDLENRVHLDGASFDVPGYLSQLDVFVMSSLYEGLPLAVLEAMAAGLPIVSTRVGGITEVCPEGDVAFFVPPADAHALARAMRDAANSSRLSAMGMNARQIATERHSLRFTWEVYENSIRRLWTQGRHPSAALDGTFVPQASHSSEPGIKVSGSVT